MSTTDLFFLAPPALDEGAIPGTAAHPAATAPRKRRGPGAGPRGSRPGGLRMTRGARAAATGMRVADAEIQRALDAPDDVAPDPRSPNRTRFQRGKLAVLVGADGMVLRVDRR